MAAYTGCYVLVVVAEPARDEDKQAILQRVKKGLLSWDVSSTGCDLSGIEKICASVKENGPSETGILIQYSTESLGVEVLVNPTVSILKQCVKNLLTSSISHKHIIHAGYTFTSSGSWIMQNGTYSFQDFLSAFQEMKGLSPRGSSIHIHCVEEGDWTSDNFSKELFLKIAKVSLNPADKIDHLPGSEHLVDCLDSVLSTHALTEIMEASPLVGNIRFNRPTLYLFPAGEGDCALFGINGFNMLIDGGFNRKPCAWEFIRHLDRLDAVLVTQLSESNLCSMSTLMKRKTLNNTYPQIGYVFCNIAEGKNPSPTEELQKDRSELLVSVVGEGHNFIQTLNDLKLVPHQCWRDATTEPFVLYHKVGHGTLEMHILSPPKDSKEMKDFLSEWSSYKEKFSCVKYKGQTTPIPLSHATSVCAILIWRPNDPKDTITRILFPGSAPQSKIFEGLEKLKSLDVIKFPTVTKASLSSVFLSKPKAMPGSKNAAPSQKSLASEALSVTSMASRNGDIGSAKREAMQAKDSKPGKDVKKAVKEQKKEIKPIKEAKKEVKDNKDVKKEVKKDTKDIKKDSKKEIKPASEKISKTAAKKPSEAAKQAPEIKKAPVKKTVKKELNKLPTGTTKTEVKKTSKPAETKTAKENINKKAAEAKTVSKPKMKPTHAAAKPSPAKSKPTPVPKSPSKVTKAIAASATIATAAVTVGVAEFIESKREKELEEQLEKEEVLKVELEEVEKDVPELLQNGVEEPEEPIHIDIPTSPLRQETMSPALSEPISLTASDTLSSAPMETVSPTPPHDIISPVEEKEVNEIKEIDLQTPTEDKYPEQETADALETPVYDHGDAENAEVDEGIVDDNVDEKLVKDGIDESDVPEDDDAGFDDTKEVDGMATSFIRDDLQPADEEAFIKDSVAKNESLPSQDYMFSTENAEIREVETISSHVVEEVEIVKQTETKYESVDAQLASATMEDSFCAGMTSENVQDIDDKYYTSDVNITTKSESNLMETSIVFEDDKINDDYVQKVINQYREQTDDDDADEAVHSQEKELVDRSVEDVMQKSQGIEMFGEPSHETYIMESEQYEVEDNDFSPSNIDIEGGKAEIQKEEVQESLNYVATDALEMQNDKYESKPEEVLIESSDIDEANINTEFDSKVTAEPSDADKYNSSEMQENELPEADVDKTSLCHQKEIDLELNLNRCDGSSLSYSTQETVVVDVHHEMDREDACEYQDYNNQARFETDPHEATANSKSDVLCPEDESEFYPQEGKQDIDEKDHDSAEDEEMVRHPTPPGEKEFYHQVGPATEDEMRDPIGPHFIAPSAFRNSGLEGDEPLYEEAEDSDSDRSKSPIIEQPVFSSTGQANFPELVTVSGGTTPSEPQSPKSPHESKKGNIAALDVMEALSEHDCSESSTQSPLLREGQNAFDHTEEIASKTQEEHASSSPNFDHESDELQKTQPEAESLLIAHEYVESEKGFENLSNIPYEETSCLGNSELDLAPECEMHSEGQISTEIDPPKFDSYEEESDPACQPESDQFSVKPDEIQFESEHSHDAKQNQTSLYDNQVQDYHSELNDFRAEAETFDQVESAQEISTSQFVNNTNVPAEFSNSVEKDYILSSEKNFSKAEKFDQYSNESSTFISESSYKYRTDTPEQNRYSSASTVELDNSKHSNENISAIDQFEVEGTNTSSPFKESCGDLEERGLESVDSRNDKINSENKDHPNAEDCESHDKDLSKQEQFYSNGYKPTAVDAPNFDGENEKESDHHSSSSLNINGQHPDSWKPYPNDYENNETTQNNSAYVPSFADEAPNKTSSEQENLSIDPHYQSDSPEDNSMRNDSPTNVPSPTNPHSDDPLHDLSAIPPPAYEGINNKFISGTEGYGSDNLNCLSGKPSSPKIKYGRASESPYGASSEEDEEDSSSLPGNVSPYAYTNKAYNQEDDADGNHIYKQTYRLEQDADDGKVSPSFDVNNPHAFVDTTPFDSHRVAPPMGYTPGYPDMHAADPGYDFRLEEWGKPMGLPTPPETGTKAAKKPLRSASATKALPKSADKRSSLDNGKSPIVSTKLTNSPLKKVKENASSEIKPIYVDLAYVPHHGDPNYSDVEFFKKIRARYYVFSGIGPSKEVLNALLEAKKCWKEDLEVTIIPTYETDTLGYWLAQNQDTLTEYSIEVAPSASRCTVNLQDHETSCAAYRLEF